MTAMATTYPFRRGPANGLFGRSFSRWFNLFTATPAIHRSSVPAVPNWLKPPKESIVTNLPQDLDGDFADEVARFAPRSQRRTDTEDLVKHFKNLNGEQPLDMMAQLIVNLTYKDMMKLTQELTKTPNGVAKPEEKFLTAEKLHAWAESRVSVLDSIPVEPLSARRA